MAVCLPNRTWYDHIRRVDNNAGDSKLNTEEKKAHGMQHKELDRTFKLSNKVLNLKEMCYRDVNIVSK